MPPEYVIEAARATALRSPCAKSKRGVVIFDPEEAERYDTHRSLYEGFFPRDSIIQATGYNGQPGAFTCTGSSACREACAKLCMHAEQRAIMTAFAAHGDCSHLELVHVKVVDGQVVAGGGPSCWQCSRMIVEVRLAGVWLFERVEDDRGDFDAWRFYEAEEFHRATLRACEVRP